MHRIITRKTSDGRPPLSFAPAARIPARMDLRDAILRIYESSGPGTAVRALGVVLSDCVDGRFRAAWVARDGTLAAAWPNGARLAAGVAEAAARVTATQLLPVDGHGGGDGAAEALLLPLADDDGTLVLVAPAGSFSEVGRWEEVGAAFARVAAQHRAYGQVEAERDTLRQRAEESEALHVLGLAANRTLDPDEVLTLVARFTRTLLGAHYVTVNTLADGSIRTVAAVGLRAQAPADDPFAARVAAARKPLTLQGEDGNVTVAEPYHAAEGMRVGLGVPLALFGETFGALVIGYRRPYELAARDTRLALTLAGHAAVAISNARLHGALAQRTGELERANEELRWTTEAKDRFFASMSHELRTPLNSVLGYQDLLLEGVVGQLEAQARAFLERAQRSTRNLLHLVNDVLDLSKIEAGKLELVVTPTRIRAIVEEALATIEPLAAARQIAVEVEPWPPLPAVHTDADRVRQILINLLSNAVKFTDQGRVTVSAALVGDGAGVPADGAQGWVEVHVADTGAGIAAENQERIFHEFEQIVGATSRGGTGLGLPISRKLARLLGGDLTVQSELGRGSTFTLRLPVRADDSVH
ncbi:MAG TPA: GAF domain-containing sensor histidine kinase [Longimicrobium sp.]|nr:GAF domain-containing sensor histidine kinase [Longimicrobium sp.]